MFYTRAQDTLDGRGYSKMQLTSLIVLRLAIGWHFLYEGFAKIFNPDWTAASFLLDSKGFLAPVFQAMAQNEQILFMVDWSNKLGLIAIGLGLMVGFLTQLASLFAIVLLLMYYLATPPFIGYTYSVPMEGSYLLVNKNLVEACALFVLMMFPTGRIIGLDRLFFPPKKKNTATETA